MEINRLLVRPHLRPVAVCRRIAGLPQQLLRHREADMECPHA